MTTKIIVIEGMSCGHCVNWVTESLKKVDGVQNAEVSLGEKNAVVDFDESLATEDALKAAVASAGYTVTSVK